MNVGSFGAPSTRDPFEQDFMQTVLVVIHLMVVAAMIGVVLLQKSEGGGLGIGSTGGFLSSRGTANVLTRTTAILAGTFFATSCCCPSSPVGRENPTRSFKERRRSRRPGRARDAFGPGGRRGS